MMTPGRNTQMIQEIPLDQLVETDLNEYIFGILDSDVNRLAEEIRDHGFTGSIDVVDLHNGTYQVISGHQRLRAVRSLGWETIPCTVSADLTDEEAYRKLIASNVLARKITPLGYARAIQVFKEQVLAKNPAIKGSKRAYIAHFFNIAEGQVQRYEAIMEMPEEIQQMCDSREFPYSVLVFAKTFQAKQKQELLRMILAYNEMAEPGTSISAVTLRQYIQAIKDQADRDASSKKIRKLMRNAEATSGADGMSGMGRVAGAFGVQSTSEVLGSRDSQGLSGDGAGYASGNASGRGRTRRSSYAEESSGTSALLEDNTDFNIHYASQILPEEEEDEDSLPIIDQEMLEISRTLTKLSEEEFGVEDMMRFLTTLTTCRTALEKISAKVPEGLWKMVKNR